MAGLLERGVKSMDEIKCITCGESASVFCNYELRGSKLGLQCNRPLCKKHLVKRDSKTLCLAHANYRMPVAVKERELIVPFQFVIPVERQLGAGEIVAIDLPPKPVVNRLQLVKDMRELVYELFQEEPHRGKPNAHFMAGMVMISPMFMPLDALIISKITGYPFLFIERAIERMDKFEICRRDEDEQLYFKCSWCALFAEGSEKILNDSEALFKECITFVLDAKVVEGKFNRSVSVDENGEFLYSINE